MIWKPQLPLFLQWFLLHVEPRLSTHNSNHPAQVVDVPAVDERRAMDGADASEADLTRTSSQSPQPVTGQAVHTPSLTINTLEYADQRRETPHAASSALATAANDSTVAQNQIVPEVADTGSSPATSIQSTPRTDTAVSQPQESVASLAVSPDQIPQSQLPTSSAPPPPPSQHHHQSGAHHNPPPANPATPPPNAPGSAAGIHPGYGYGTWVPPSPQYFHGPVKTVLNGAHIDRLDMGSDTHHHYNGQVRHQ
ncbi:hypothetical protein FB45DRAFT_927265 [Roridomyces roridus]|uniref:Uncharacterized protein n=1 Tax=Roridomyces roridus TaxID=1738132 RepID=A0AAD7BIG5_9AGAR|nr:hypothetical protein FB45DRAFT_927265 [Roridomyces roridus]